MLQFEFAVEFMGPSALVQTKACRDGASAVNGVAYRPFRGKQTFSDPASRPAASMNDLCLCLRIPLAKCRREGNLSSLESASERTRKGRRKGGVERHCSHAFNPYLPDIIFQPVGSGENTPKP